jgi:putative membrane protein
VTVPPTPAAVDTGPPVFRRLHPLTPIVRGLRSIGVITGFVSYQAWGRAGFPALAAVAGALVLGWFVVAWFAWRFTGFRIEDRELHITEGVFARRHRTVPLERVQAVDVVQPIVARLFGLAEVRMEVVGGGKKAEAPLAYLTRSEAETVRVQLLRRSAVAETAPVPDGTDQPAPATVEEHAESLFTVDPRALVTSQVLRPNTLVAPLLLIWPIMEFASEDTSFTAIFTFLSALVGLVQSPVRRLLNEWGFTVGADGDGLRVHRGMLDIRNQTVPVNRVQGVRIRRPLLWRPFGWVRVEIDVAGYGHEGAEHESGRSALIPVATEAVAYAVLHAVFPAVPEAGPEALDIQPPPRRARIFAPLQFGRLGYAITDTVLLTRNGWPTASYDVILHARAQSVRVTQGWWQRRRRLASVHLDPAGGHTTPTVLHQDAAQAMELLGRLASLARVARRTTPLRTTPAGAHRA